MITKGQCPSCLATAGEEHKPDCLMGTPLMPVEGVDYQGTKSGRLGPGAGQSNVPKEKQASPRVTVPPLRVRIREIDHREQRYDTCGDWQWLAPGYPSPHPTLMVTVSTLPDRREMFLVAIHELIEAFLCGCAGITEAQVDVFDLSQEYYFEGEPGDQPAAPYYKQHQFATGIERILAAEVGVNWLEYERHIQELSHGQ